MKKDDGDDVIGFIAILLCLALAILIKEVGG